MSLEQFNEQCVCVLNATLLLNMSSNCRRDENKEGEDHHDVKIKKIIASWPKDINHSSTRKSSSETRY